MWQKVTHDMGWNTPNDDKDASFDFACAADDKYLYVAVKVQDDKKVVNESPADWFFMDDSVEIYVDGDNSKSREYEPDVNQITIGRFTSVEIQRHLN